MARHTPHSDRSYYSAWLGYKKQAVELGANKSLTYTYIKKLIISVQVHEVDKYGRR
jgi:hypothetical protein